MAATLYGEYMLSTQRESSGLGEAAIQERGGYLRPSEAARSESTSLSVVTLAIALEMSNNYRGPVVSGE